MENTSPLPPHQAPATSAPATRDLALAHPTPSGLATSGLTTSGPSACGSAARDLALTPDATHLQIFDAYGHDPADNNWVPVLKKPRADGWSPEKQRAFIATLADTGSVTRAARAVNMSREAAYALRRSAHADGFSTAWDAAIGAPLRHPELVSGYGDRNCLHP
ncbi:MAG: LysR family transcriptional regulator [Sphingopyxis sp.]